jgi:general nucleoside transport system permease protein
VSAEVIVGVVVTAIQLSVAVLYAAMGEVVGQRSGIVNLGIEGVMLMGAATGFAVTATTGSALLGVAAGAASGAAFNLVMGLMVVTRRSNQLASGLALYFLGIGLSTLIGASFVGAHVQGLGQLGFPGLASLPEPYARLFRQDLLVWLMVPAAVLLWWLLFRTRWGLRTRAVGEDRTSAFAAGIRTARRQYQALGIAGALYGLGGAHLAIAFTKTWQEYMTAGRGFIAIVIVIFSLWNPIRAIGGALLFGAAMAVGLQLQAQGAPVSPFLLDMLPYLVTMAVVLIWARPTQFAVPGGLREVFTGTAK